MALGVKRALPDLRAPRGPRDPAVSPFKGCLECQVKKERKEIPDCRAHRVSQAVLVHQDAMAPRARGAFLERTDPPALQVHQGQLAFPEPLESPGSQEAWDPKVPSDRLVSLEQRERGERGATFSPKRW